MLDDSDWRYRIQSDAAFRFGHPYGRAWWHNFSDLDSPLSAEVIEEVNARLAEVSPQHTLEYMQETKRDVDGPGAGTGTAD